MFFLKFLWVSWIFHCRFFKGKWSSSMESRQWRFVRTCIFSSKSNSVFKQLWRSYWSGSFLQLKLSTVSCECCSQWGWNKSMYEQCYWGRSGQWRNVGITKWGDLLKLIVVAVNDGNFLSFDHCPLVILSLHRSPYFWFSSVSSHFSYLSCVTVACMHRVWNCNQLYISYLAKM